MLNVIKKRSIYLSISAILFIISIIAIKFFPYNLGIDMTGWTQIEYSYKNKIDLEKYKKDVSDITSKIEYGVFDKNWQNKIKEKVINDTKVYKISWENKFVVVTWFNSQIFESDDPKFEKKLKTDLEEIRRNLKINITKTLQKNNSSVELSKYTNIWKSFWDYIKKTAFITLFVALIAISIYIAIAFSGSISWISSLSFAWVALITLLHDVIISTWLYVYTGSVFADFKIDTFFITALLTILGYSINDTIVVFDRIRENLKIFWWRKKNWKKLDEIINMSVSETLTRSIYTSLTVLIVLISILFLGPESINWFILTMIFWTIVWTYSSIFIASPLLYEINKNKKLEVYKEKVYNPEDKIVV